MASRTQTANKPRQKLNRDGMNKRSVRGEPRAGEGNQGQSVKAVVEANATATRTQATTSDSPVDGNICFICAEVVKYFALAGCNHRTCHVCALRLRALYKRLDCTLCKEPQPFMVFTSSHDAPFLSFDKGSSPFHDEKLSIFFETQEMMEETLELLRFNCPDENCTYVATGWDDLKLHVRGVHERRLCDLCLRHKKLFAHEHALYTRAQLLVHMPSLQHGAPKANTGQAQVEHETHPLCEFCRQCVFDSDELYAHMREKHEECFVCKQNGARDQYFRDWHQLDSHFSQSHHRCPHPSCMAQKFIVFNTSLDLQAHIVETHGNEMTARDRKDARRLVPEFTFEGGVNARGPRRDRATDSPPPAQGSSQAGTAAGPSRPSSRRTRDAFGANLTAEGSGASSSSQPQSQIDVGRRSPAADIDPIVAERQAALTARVKALAPHPETAIIAVGASIRGYNASESSARDLISTVWNTMDQNLDSTAGIVNLFVDILEDEEKKRELLASWNAFKVEQRKQFPDLVPTVVGSSYAGITSGRMLKIKRSTSSNSSQSSRRVWDRVAEAAQSTSAQRQPSKFPPLSSAAVSPIRTSPAPNGQSSSARAMRPGPQPSAKSSPNLKPAIAQNIPDSFPQLPNNTGRARTPPILRRNILGESEPVQSAWRSSPSDNNPSKLPVGDLVAEVTERASGKSKKGKGKQKQTLFTLGSLATSQPGQK